MAPSRPFWTIPQCPMYPSSPREHEIPKVGLLRGSSNGRAMRAIMRQGIV